VKASQRPVERTAMDWEIYPLGIYKVLKRFNAYKGIKKIIITENGAAFDDQLVGGRVQDDNRIRFFQKYLEQVLRAKREGVKVEGYFAWSFTDNFEWAEGYRPRFGLVYVDYPTQKRIVKASGFWWKEFLEKGLVAFPAKAE
jgi:beta-glucosidase